MRISDWSSDVCSSDLGGKAPHIIFADDDLDQAINAATGSAWALCGQSCALGSRVLVERPVYDRVVEAFRERAGRVRVGMPRSEEHTSELQSLMRNSYAVFRLKNKKQNATDTDVHNENTTGI